MKDFTNKVVVITGAGSGIGRELAVQFASRGAVLALNDWKQEGLDETWNLLPPANRGYQERFDVGDRAAMEAFAESVVRELDRVDVVINNAGFSVKQTPAIRSTIEDYEKTLRVNLWGVLYGSYSFLPHLRARPEASLVNISSIFGIYAFPGSAPYNVSKFGVRGFTETLRVEMRGTPLHVACVHPGGIRTNIHKNVEIEDPKERERFIRNFEKKSPTTAARAAEVIIAGIEKKKGRILIGKDAWFVDKVVRMLPAKYETILTRWLDPRKFMKESDR